TASPALLTLAADPAAWDRSYLAALEEAGLLLPDGATPPVRQDPLVISVVNTLSSGILARPAGSQIITTGSLADFLDPIRQWYGNDASLTAPTDPNAPQFTQDSHSFEGILTNLNPVPALPTFAQYDQGLSHPTAFEAFNVYVPWIPWEKRGAGIPPEFQI